MTRIQSRTRMKLCVINIGLYRTGTTTLTRVFADVLGSNRVQNTFPNIDINVMREMLFSPQIAVKKWYSATGKQELESAILDNIHLCDGWYPLLAFLRFSQLRQVEAFAEKNGIILRFVATERDNSTHVISDIHHWVVHDLEKNHNLSETEMTNLENWLKKRTQMHNHSVESLRNQGLSILKLKLEEIHNWPVLLPTLPLVPGENSWRKSISSIGRLNANPRLPLEGILLTFRLEGAYVAKIFRLLEQIENDSLCRYLIVLGFDQDQYDSTEALEFISSIQSRPRVESLVAVQNTYPKAKGNTFPACQVWNSLAEEAWKLGADWVIFLGDDVIMQSSFHYRAIYRAFLDIQRDLNCEFCFGCPWIHDITFPGFPSFPVIGKVHRKIFGNLIPDHRNFINQDLDPYIHRVYQKFGSSVHLKNVKIINSCGGSKENAVRYRRVPAIGWKDWVLNDVTIVENYLAKEKIKITPKLMIDVVVPTFRIKLENLERICSLAVPEDTETLFIIIVDNPEELKSMYGEQKICNAQYELENHLRKKSNNFNIRVRCNDLNIGAPASRNVGISESSAEYIIFLDDDVLPESDLLSKYQIGVRKAMDSEPTGNFIGVIGMVRFPRRSNMTIKHAAILMSYLTFMFEISTNQIYKHPSWAVTANVLLKKTPYLKFDESYAKTGGGEDVDLCLRLGSRGGKFYKQGDAVVHHDFWEGSILDTAKHFFSWSAGDSALFYRHRGHCYYSAPNIVEFLVIASFLLYESGKSISEILICHVFIFLTEVGYEVWDPEFQDRRNQLNPVQRSLQFCIKSLIVANFFIMAVETGRLYGHVRRGHFKNVFRRFDWHCGRLKNGPYMTRKKEIQKLVIFIIALVLYSHLTSIFRNTLRYIFS